MSKQAGAVVSYKRALISAKAIQNDKALESEKAEKFLSDISPFLTKKGEVRKNLSKKKQEEFNKLVKEYKGKSGAPTKAKIKKQQSKAIATGKQRGTFANKQEYNRSLELFKNPAIKGLMNNGLSSQQVVTLQKTFSNVSTEKISQVAHHLLNRMENDTPAEALGYLDQDDAYLLLEEALANEFGYPDINEEIPFD